MQPRSITCSVLVVLGLVGCAPPSSVYVAAAATDRAAWFVHRESTGREVVDRVVECHEDRVPPCVRFEVVGVRDADWYAEWVAQGRASTPSAPAAPTTSVPAPTGPTPGTPPPGSTAPGTAPAPTPSPPAPSAPRPPPAWTP
ncbi:MAG: hypothetical protein IT379_29615 [Deltaproteobacteria bacterium]|nr:hypothetical protein [Deltaproteobacteria bacterium]